MLSYNSYSPFCRAFTFCLMGGGFINSISPKRDLFPLLMSFSLPFFVPSACILGVRCVFEFSSTYLRGMWNPFLDLCKNFGHVLHLLSVFLSRLQLELPHLHVALCFIRLFPFWNRLVFLVGFFFLLFLSLSSSSITLRSLTIRAYHDR